MALYRVAAIAAFGLLLTSCHSQAQDAEDRYNIVSATGSLGEQCVKAREVRDAWLAAKDAGRYRQWALTADIDCLKSNQNGDYLPANDTLRERIEREAADVESNAEAAAVSAAPGGPGEPAISPEGAAALSNAVPENLKRYEAEGGNGAAAAANAH